MLHEISHSKQLGRSLYKRWFTCTEMNLVVWFRQNRPVSFQLSFDKQKQTISWDEQRGFHLYSEEKSNIYTNRNLKRAVSINLCDQNQLTVIRRDFLVVCENIDVGLTDFIYARLMEYPTAHSKPYASRTNQPVAR